MHTTYCNFNGVTLTKVIITHYSVAFLQWKRTKHTVTQLINRGTPYYCISTHAHIKPFISVANRLHRFYTDVILTVEIVSTTSWWKPQTAQDFSQHCLSLQGWGLWFLKSQSLTRKTSLRRESPVVIIIIIVVPNISILIFEPTCTSLNYFRI